VRALPLSIAAGAALVLGLTACGSSGSSTTATSAPGSTSTGTATGAATAGAPAVHPPLNKSEDLAQLEGIKVADHGTTKTPTVTITKKPVSVTATTVRVLKKGTGAVSTSASRVSLVIAFFNGTTGKELQSFYGKPAQSLLLTGNTNTLSGLPIAIDGVKAGSRILSALPPADAFGSKGNSPAGVAPTDNLVVVADIVSVGTPLTKAQGATVPPKAGLPTVAFDAAKGPTITVPKTTPSTSLVVQPLVQGTGATVATGQSVTVNYTGVTYSTGQVFDSSWGKKPFTFTIGASQVISGWDKGLVGQKVGSRILLVIPPAEGYKDKANGSIPANSTLVFAIDILDAG